MKYPDFIVIGAMKTGTTALWRNLNKHPKITMGKNFNDPKPTSTEIRFWNNASPHVKGKDVNWYKGLFKGEVCGEKCANYCEKASTIKRIVKHIPNIKLIMGLREPVDRAYSEFVMQKHTAKSFTSGKRFEQLFDHYLPRSLYHKTLTNNVLPYVKKNNLYLFVQERMATDTVSELNKLYRWLGLEGYTIDLSKVGSKDRDSKIDSYRTWRTEYDPINPKIKKKYYDRYFNKENKKLFKFLGYKIPEWA